MNVTGYQKLVLLVPNEDLQLLTETISDFPERTKIVGVTEFKGDGYLSQQVFKLQAYKYCDADIILFSDSDVFYHNPINLQDYIKGGKPEILHTPWAQVGDAIAWKEPTEKTLGFEVPSEGMRRHGMAFHKSTLINLNNFLPDLEKVVMMSERFSEFNLMTSYAMKMEPEEYNFISTDNWQYTEPICQQIWSHSKKDGDELQQKEYARTKQVIKDIFNEDI